MCKDKLHLEAAVGQRPGARGHGPPPTPPHAGRASAHGPSEYRAGPGAESPGHQRCEAVRADAGDC
eukprot:1446868-Alexandrium_andersonii.AAC.1